MNVRRFYNTEGLAKSMVPACWLAGCKFGHVHHMLVNLELGAVAHWYKKEPNSKPLPLSYKDMSLCWAGTPCTIIVLQRSCLWSYTSL
jgi:hypothetical protein